MGKLIKLLIVLIIIVLLVVGGLMVFQACSPHTPAGTVIKQVTGNEDAADFADKVMNEEELTDEEIQDALGVDDETYGYIKQGADQFGIDINDSSQLKELIAQNPDKALAITEIVSRYQNGEIGYDEAILEITALFGEQ